MPTRREAILEELDRWRDAGLIPSELHGTLVARTASDARLDEGLGSPSAAEGAPAPTGLAGRGRSAVEALQLVGGLFLGAGLIALASFLDLATPLGAHLLLVAGGALVAMGIALTRLTPRREGLEEAALAAGIVAMAATFPFTDSWVHGLATALVMIVLHVARKGEGASTLLGAIAYGVSVISFIANLGGENARVGSLTLLGLLLPMAALLAWHRSKEMSHAVLALYLHAIAAAVVFVATAHDVRSDTAVQLILGAYYGGAMMLGAFFGLRSVVGSAAAGLAIDAVVFAFDVGGPGTAVVLLLAFGGLLVWQAEFLRRYFAPRRGAPTRAFGQERE